MKKLREDITKQLRSLAITKQLNFLIGSGVCFDVIPGMGDKAYRNDEIENKPWVSLSVNDKEDVSKKLTAKVSEVSSELLSDSPGEDVANLQKSFDGFMQSIVSVLNLSNSRQTPRSANIFSTNYDLFIEKSADNVLKTNRLVFNDGASGYFERYLDGQNYNRLVSYKGLNDNYISEIPQISLIKPHGSINWQKTSDGKIQIKNEVVSNSEVVNPLGFESEDTFLNNHFHEMLRLFQLELDKPQTVLFVSGFSFQDPHISKMVSRAIQNPELLTYVFAYDDKAKIDILNNIKISERVNFKVLTPRDIFENVEIEDKLTLEVLTEILNGSSLEDLKENGSSK
ncbi:SIR2 family protein [Lactococcus protaetiae]|uniref:Uncharacterized protein n=1 Tax=Lactococcus protaetiae TaxID=2592653 RepID=A0A514Z8U5_9LACT|nr:SIR2 family protein [Lactococcus protaetiae]QDK70983.1 hypothetical protein FLP15_07185 [Lactococcus protaetiae]